jgi:hypothetical protein
MNLENKITGRFTIRDKNTSEIILEKTNAIHYENFGEALALAAAGNAEGHIYEMHFGNGASIIDSVGAISYYPPNVEGVNANLYNPTYFKIVDQKSSANSNPTANFMEVKHTRGNLFTDIIIVCTLDYGEPSGQDAFDLTNDLEGDFIFDEIGLKSFSSVAGAGKLLTHAIFSPIQKSLNRSYEIEYVIRIATC